MAIFGAVLDGIEAVRVRVTAEPGTFDVKGLSEAATRETRVRVRAAFAQLGKQPSGVVTVAREDGLPFAYGAGLDLAIAVAASGMPVGADVLFAGELSLMGEIRSVRGAVPIALLVRNHRIQGVFPEANAMLAVPSDMLGTRLYARHLSDVLDAIEIANLPTMGGSGAWLLPLPCVGEPSAPHDRDPLAWSDVAHLPVSQTVRNAVEGGASVLVLVGPVGSGRTMFSRRIASLLPTLTDEQRLDVDIIASAAGLPTHGTRPFRAPHHTASTVAVVGGGSPVRPGEVSLAHHGVLLVDEANEAPRAVIDALISTLKKGETRVMRLVGGESSVTTMPARPAVTVISITLPTPRDTSLQKDGTLTTREQASIEALTKRYHELAERFRAELGATLIKFPRIEARDLARKGAVS